MIAKETSLTETNTTTVIAIKVKEKNNTPQQKILILFRNKFESPGIGPKIL